MPLINFRPQFVEPIRKGVKHHTIRGERAYPIKVGDNLYLYCGARTKSCFQILDEPQPCTKIQNIEIRYCPRHRVFSVNIDGVELNGSECERLAVADGFKDFAEMMKFWEGRLPFKGHIIHWAEPRWVKVKQDFAGLGLRAERLNPYTDEWE